LIIAISITLFFIVLRFTVTLFNFISNPKLTRVNRIYNDLVSILIPARNEEENIITLLESISRQDGYQNFEVIIYDDESSDRTYELCSAFAAERPGFSVIKGARLPNAWVGKNYACYQLAKQANGTYFLFLDADEHISDNLINSAVHRMHLYKLGLLSLSPNQGMNSPGSITTGPLLHYMLLSLLPLRLVYLVKIPAIAAAFGQFMLFDAAIYRQNQWHEQVKDNLVADTEIMKLLKSAKYNGETLLPNGMIGCRMYNSYREAINGLSKNFLAAFNYSIPGVLIYILLLIGGPMIVIMTFNFQLIFFMGGLIMLARIMISLSAGENAWYNVLLHPVQMVNLVIIAFLSIQKHLTKTIVWKGRRV
jgi:glycosyltransferase involved in cell wall biosynthesis